MSTICAEKSNESDLYPRVGELWDCEGKISVICGNSFSKNGRIWIMAWDSGLCGHAKPEWLLLRPDRKILTEGAILERFIAWAREGNSDAMWWLAWWFEGRNHQKSVWYYVAALRANPKGHGWAHGRIMSDARSACMCRGIPRPDLSFLDEIPEIAGERIGRDWVGAVTMAEQAVHIAAEQQLESRLTKMRYLAPADRE